MGLLHNTTMAFCHVFYKGLKMQITMTSGFSGKSHTREINVTGEQLSNWRNGELIQNAMPDLSDDDREFIMTGVTPEEWETAFGTGEE